jgi:hypothetical protein
MALAIEESKWLSIDLRPHIGGGAWGTSFSSDCMNQGSPENQNYVSRLSETSTAKKPYITNHLNLDFWGMETYGEKILAYEIGSRRILF